MNALRQVAFEGAEVAYRKDGAGPALVLVHGTGGDSESNWDALAEGLSADWTVVRPDYSGSGATVDDGRPLAVAYLAGQVRAAAEHAEAVPFHLVGFSLGAAVAIHIAAEHPDLVRSLTLIAGFASADDPRLRLQFELWRDLAAKDRSALARLILLTGFSPDAVADLGENGVEEAIQATLKTANWPGLARQIDLDLTLDVTEQAASIETPTLVVGCTLDHMVAPSHARRLAESIAGARYVELPTGHLAPMEAPQAVRDVLTEFLGTAGTAGEERKAIVKG